MQDPESAAVDVHLVENATALAARFAETTGRLAIEAARLAIESAALAAIGPAIESALRLTCKSTRFAIEATALTARLAESTQLRLNALLPPALEVIGGQRDPVATFERFAALLQAIARRSTYLALLAEYPAALRQLARLLAASPWAAQMITRQPQLLDELIAPQHLMSVPDWAQLAVQLREELDAQAGDTEAQMDALRRFKQVQTLRLLAQDVAGRLTLEAFSDHLSYLADTLLAETLARCWAGLKTRHRDTPSFAVIGYGKLGGKELGYASDLDLVFLYDDADERAQEI